jgi:glycosyltransferase involved in cell wall biosynthesis
MSDLEVAICVTTYQKPWHLRRTLASILGQRGIAGRFEAVITDDGSTDETPEIVEQFRRTVDFPVAFTTHPHAAFQVSKCRNEGARATRAPYLLFVDGDCVLPPDHVATHLAQRRPGYALLGDCYRIEREISDTLSEEGARRGEFLTWEINGERGRHARAHRKAVWYNLIRHPRKPKLVGNNFSVWRADFERINGFDEKFCGWGQEDDDLGLRLRRAGVRLQSILGKTRSYHLWHPRDPSTTVEWREGVNVPYFLRRGGLTRCRNGIVKREVKDLSFAVTGAGEATGHVMKLLREKGIDAAKSQSPRNVSPEVEILALGGVGRFSRAAEFRMLVALDHAPPYRKLVEQANLIVAPTPLLGLNGKLQFGLAEFSQALEAIA